MISNIHSTLFVSDLDWTLLNPKASLSTFTRDTINKLIDRGIHFTYATARSINSSCIATRGLNLKLPVVTYNGCCIIDSITLEVIEAEYLDNAQNSFIQSAILSSGLSPLVYSYRGSAETVTYSVKDVKNSKGIQAYLNSRKTDKRLNPIHDSSLLYDGKIFYYTLIDSYDQLKPLYDIIRVREDINCLLQHEQYRDEYWLEIMPGSATKANAILKLKHLLNLDRLVCFGDGLNDIPMFKIADESYAVSNAVHELKDIATNVIESNEDNGVAKYMLTLKGLDYD